MKFVLVCVLMAINLAVIYCDNSSKAVIKDGDVRIAVSSSSTALQPTGSMVALTDTENVNIKITDDEFLSSDGRIHISVDIAVELSSFTKSEQFYVKIYSGNELVICEGRFGQLLSAVVAADKIQCTQQTDFLQKGDNVFRILITSWPNIDVVLLDTFTHCIYSPAADGEYALDYWLIDDRSKVVVAVGGAATLFTFAILRSRWRIAPIVPSLAIDASDDPKQGPGDDDPMDYYVYPYSFSSSYSNSNKVIYKLVAFTLGVLPAFLSSTPGRASSSSSSSSSSSIIGSAGIKHTSSPTPSMWTRSRTDRR